MFQNLSVLLCSNAAEPYILAGLITRLTRADAAPIWTLSDYINIIKIYLNCSDEYSHKCSTGSLYEAVNLVQVVGPGKTRIT